MRKSNPATPLPATEELPLLSSVEDLQGVLPTFNVKFLQLHAGAIIADPKFAVVELVANAWDAGADRVEVVWPAAAGDLVSVADNGIGMTKAEFVTRWSELNYNRLANQGEVVQFPKGRKKRHRLAYGRNGVGRHAMFCFADEYYVRTSKDGVSIEAHVTRAHGAAPFKIEILKETPSAKHGTTVFAHAADGIVPVEEIMELIGSRFISDPQFAILVNGHEVSLTDLEHLSASFTVTIPGYDDITVRRFDSEDVGRTSKQSGVAWWVKGRLVGMPSWDLLDGALLDARTSTAKRVTYIAEVDQLAADVKPDWSGFFGSKESFAVRRGVGEFVRDDLRELLADVRRDRKREALAASRETIQSLPPISQEMVARFAEEIQVKSPTVSAKDLEHAVQVLANLEQARTGYALLEKLSALSPDDLDGLHAILDEWTVTDAKQVLGELRYRLRLIVQLEGLVEKHTADELHDLQPLFERGLWMFGPKFESISFTSNRSLATVVEKLLGGTEIGTPAKRPDFVILPDSSIGVYSSDAYDGDHEVSGIEAVIVVELKRGGFEVTDAEKDQAMRYAREIRRSGKVSRETEITCYVLGTNVDPSAEETVITGQTKVMARSYQAILRQAHARTFNLLAKVESSKAVKLVDADLRAVVDPPQYELAPSPAAKAQQP